MKKTIVLLALFFSFTAYADTIAYGYLYAKPNRDEVYFLGLDGQTLSTSLGFAVELAKQSGSLTVEQHNKMNECMKYKTNFAIKVTSKPKSNQVGITLGGTRRKSSFNTEVYEVECVRMKGFINTWRSRVSHSVN